jgi:hypothetical protein
VKLARLAAVLLLVTGCADVAADPTSNQTPLTVAAPEPEPTIVVAPVTESVPEEVVDPLWCMDGGAFVKTADGFICASRYHPLIPMSIPEMVAAVGLPAIFSTTIIPRESRWDPSARNRYDCRGLVQMCQKAGYFARLGYSWATDWMNPWVHLLVTKLIYDELELQPWQCGRCSLR